jgi:hypothetical protein
MSDRTDMNPSTRPTQARGDAARAAIAVLIALLVLGVVPPGGAIAQDDPPFRTSTYEWAEVCPAGLSWTGDEPMRVPGPKPRDDEDVPMHRVGDGLYYRPGALAINGMKRVDAYLDTGDEAQLEQALKQADRLRRHALNERDAWWLPFWYDYLPAGQFAPWFNAMAQGLVLSFFTRLHHVTGDPVHLEAADRVFASFLRLGQTEEPWVAYVDGRGFLWLEHYPLPEPDHVLNAHLHAVFGIYEYWQATRSPAARQVLNGAVTTVRRNVEAYRQPGDISLYGLSSRTPNPKYHQIHVWQLNLLARLSGDDYFAEMAARLRDDRRPVGRVNGRPQRHDANIVGPHCRPGRWPSPIEAAPDPPTEGPDPGTLAAAARPPLAGRPVHVSGSRV